jgi:hypothetical protein
MTITLPSLSAGSAAGAYSAAVVNAAISQQKTNMENIVNGIQGFDALLWNNSTATLATDTLNLSGKPRALVIDTQASGATDDLSTISNGTAYQQLWIKAANVGRVITVKHNVGNIKLWGAADVVLNSTNWLQLFYDGTQWSDVFFSLPTYVLPTQAMVINTARTVLGANATSVTISSIPSTYQHLMLVLEARTDFGSIYDQLVLRFNADATAANYYSQYVNATGATVTAAEVLGISVTGIHLNYAAVGTTGSAGNGHCVVFIKNYASTTMRRTVTFHNYTHYGNGTTGLIESIGGGDWTNAAAAISSITFLPYNGTNILTNSAYTLYGLN